METGFRPHNGRYLSLLWWEVAAALQEKIIGTFYLGKRPGTDKPTLVVQHRRLASTKPQGGWSTNSQITKMEKGKDNILSHI